MEGKNRTKFALLSISLLVLTTLSIVEWYKYAEYRYRQEVIQSITKDVAIQIATSYLKIPRDTPLKSINLVKTPVTKNKNAWEVILDYRVLNTTRLSRCKVYVNLNTGEVLSYSVAGRIAED